MDDIKNCPFCNGEPWVTDMAYASVSCSRCHTTTKTFNDRKIAIAQWNHRVPDPATAAVIEAARAFLHPCVNDRGELIISGKGSVIERNERLESALAALDKASGEVEK